MRNIWKVIGTSVAGTKHLSAGVPCQDAFDFEILEDGTLIASVADGAGSAARALEASLLAAQSSVRHLATNVASVKPQTPDACEALLRDCMFDTRLRLEKKAGESGDGSSALGDFSTTLLAVFVTDSFLAALQVGDGAIVYRQSPEALKVACVPEHGEYLNETVFLTSDKLEQRAQYSVVSRDGVDAVAMLSDGLEMLSIVYGSQTAHPPFFDPLFDFARQHEASVEDLERFLLSDRVCERSDDDKTLVLAVLVDA